MKRVDKSFDLLQLFNRKAASGVLIVRADTSKTLVFEGSAEPIDLEMFEMPVVYLPMKAGDRFFVLPILTADDSQRWAVLQKIN